MSLNDKPPYDIDALFKDNIPEALNLPNVFGNTPSFKNAFTDAVDPDIVGTGEIGVQLANVGKKVREITVAVGDDWQKNLDKLELDGGGILNINAGIHTIETNVTVPNSVKIVGENRDSTIVDFNSTSTHFIVAGTDAYTTGTISSIGSGGTSVVGSGTAWNTSSNVTTNHQIFIDGRWYIIAAVVSDTAITLAEPYKDAGTFAGTYRAAILRNDIHFNGLTIKNSTGTALDFDDVRDVRMDDLLLIANNKGFTMDYFTFAIPNGVIVTNSTSNGYEITNGRFFTPNALASLANGGHGAVLNTLQSCSWGFCANDGNTNDGFNMTDVDRSSLIVQADGNGGQGIEMVSGCDDNRISIANMNANTSDGIKLTATCDNNTITTAVIRANGGYGVNIANANCDNNVIATNHFGSNSSGAVNDSGTGTKVTGNIGVDDNSVDVQSFSTDGTWTKPSGATSVEVYIFGAGGGGGSGKSLSSNTLSNGIAGGGGGGSGAYGYKKFQAGGLGATESVTVGSGGSGGASATEDSDGNAGSAGGDSSFGTSTLVKTMGGGGGAAPVGNGAAVGGVAGAVGNGEITQAGDVGGASQSNDVGLQGVDTAILISSRGGGGGGGGRGDQTGENGAIGGGFITNYVKAGGTAGSAEGGVGGIGLSSSDLLFGGTGGGGGAGDARSSGTSTGGTGGDGINGSGGGGGGCSYTNEAGSATSGAGGTGGDGLIVIISVI